MFLQYQSENSFYYRSGTVNSNTVNSKFHLIRSYCEIFFYHFPNISCLKCTVNSNFHLIRSKTLLTNDFELTVSNLYRVFPKFCSLISLNSKNQDEIQKYFGYQRHSISDPFLDVVVIKKFRLPSLGWYQSSIVSSINIFPKGNNRNAF